MERNPRNDGGDAATAASQPSQPYEAPRVETVLTPNDLEREVMYGVITQM
jgi:hypothetical protein